MLKYNEKEVETFWTIPNLCCKKLSTYRNDWRQHEMNFLDLPNFYLEKTLL